VGLSLKTKCNHIRSSTSRHICSLLSLHHKEFLDTRMILISVNAPFEVMRTAVSKNSK